MKKTLFEKKSDDESNSKFGEKLLKKWNSNSEGFEKELAKIGIYTIESSSGSIIGSGQSNTVREVLWKGKRAVVRYSTDPEELQKLLEFVLYKSKMPAKYSKHFPKIYKTFDLKDQYGFRFYGAVVEFLDPLPANLKKDLREKSFSDVAKKSEIGRFISKFEKSGKLEDFIYSFLEKRGLAESLFDKIKSDMETFVFPTLRTAAEENWRFSEIADKLEDHFSQNEKHRLDFWTFCSYVLSTIRDPVIPKNYEKNYEESGTADSHPHSKVKSFWEFLKALAAAGYAWRDLHVENFMIRKSTGDFVVVDPGYFEEIGK